MEKKITLFWFRRDLRLEDNHGLYKALESGYPVLPVFIFDQDILAPLEDQKDARVQFLHQEVLALKKVFEDYGSSFLVRYGRPLSVWQDILEEFHWNDCNKNKNKLQVNYDKFDKIEVSILELLDEGSKNIIELTEKIKIKQNAKNKIKHYKQYMN